jgi:predicted ABC-type transport system involved in lysophospholipase L1 biosynthesis ATPase subunit
MAEVEAVVRMRGVRKDYRGLRPLRVARLDLAKGQSLALLGVDRAAGEVLVDLIMGTTLPDAGEVVVCGEATSAVTNGQAWLGGLDRFGLLSERVVLVDQLTAEQNLAMPLSLDLDSLSIEVRSRVGGLADEVGLPARDLRVPAGGLPAASRLRVRLGRALALGPHVLLAEHPNASLSRDEAVSFAADFSRIVAARGLAALVLTADRAFAASAAGQVLTLEPGTGVLRASSLWQRWLAR